MEGLVITSIFLVMVTVGLQTVVFAQTEPEKKVVLSESIALTEAELPLKPEQYESCRKQFSLTKAKEGLCKEFHVFADCHSVKGEPLFHWQKNGANPKGKKILVIGQIHGDEPDAGLLAYQWTARVARINPQNTWRVIPKLNPDGAVLKTRQNANGVDLNRNFQTVDWSEKASDFWATNAKKDPRRFPGKDAASEPETQCMQKHLDDFKPEIVVSIHTPYGLLDFDGPKMQMPKFTALPWKFLGNFPGSLGRYMWMDRHVPVLTIELAPNSLSKNGKAFDQLQDLISLLITNTERAFITEQNISRGSVKN